MNTSIRFISRILCLIAFVFITFSALNAQNPSGNEGKRPSKTFDISELKDGKHVLETNERSKVIIIMTEGKPTSIGRTINGQFHPFRPNSPCADYIVMPCADGSAPIAYYDPYEKQCVAVCENFVGLLLPAVQKVREAARRTR